MLKQVTFLGRTETGVHARGLFGSAGAFEKVAGAPPFADWATGDEIRKFLGTLSKKDRAENCYCLVNALAAGEYFGANINADFFPWNALAHEGNDYGYKTFLNAHAFQHHKNKDSARAFGVPVLSLLNHPMKRVELIIKLSREKAKAEAADGIITRIDQGDFPDVSMGCKVPFDVCSICGNKSKDSDDYCQHMKPPAELRHIFGPNKILIDGRRICVHNLTPRFFDISFVFIGADKTAKVMAKLAQVGRQLCMGDICTLSSESPLLYDMQGKSLYFDMAPSVTKTASVKEECDCACGGDCHDFEKLGEAFGVKESAAKKVAEIIKNVPAGSFAMERLPELESDEPSISVPDLDQLAGSAALRRILGATALMGMVLKPQEFQHVVLRRMGEDDLVDELNEKNQVFKPSSDFESGIDIDCCGEIDDCLDLATKTLSKYVRERGALGKPFVFRVTFRSRGEAKKVLPTATPIAHPLLDKLGAAYNGYRRDLMMKLSQAVEVIESDPKLREAVLGNGLVDMFSKHASTNPVVSPDSVAYFTGAHLANRGLLTSTAMAEAIAVHNEWILQGGGHDSA